MFYVKTPKTSIVYYRVKYTSIIKIRSDFYFLIKALILMLSFSVNESVFNCNITDIKISTSKFSEFGKQNRVLTKSERKKIQTHY